MLLFFLDFNLQILFINKDRVNKTNPLLKTTSFPSSIFTSNIDFLLTEDWYLFLSDFLLLSLPNVTYAFLDIIVRA